MSEQKSIKIIGGGLAGCEAALQLAKLDWLVDLYEMRPNKMTSAHQTPFLAELVCSNSLKSELLSTASGLLKEELRLLDCELLKIAENNKLPAGNALAVDRNAFASEVTDRINNNPNIKVIYQEVTTLDDDLTIIATGPLSSDWFIQSLLQIVGSEDLFFFDAIAPIISTESIDLDKVYYKARYDKGSADYLNCPFSKEEYQRFVEALIVSEKYIGKEFEREYFNDLRQSKDLKFYENCMPIEELARRGEDTLRYGVMRPVGLEDPASGKRPYAVLQLRIENKDRTAYNLVGCQTMMTQASQKNVFRLIPGLENAEFYRFGSIHRNTYLNSPHLLADDLTLKQKRSIYVAGQLSGVEGYVESIASGLLVSLIVGKKFFSLPEETIIGQLWRRLTNEENQPFVPINANYGLLPPMQEIIKGKQKKKELLAARSIKALKDFFGS
ncbi:MAG: methylenetetrahydrofolate--tRNA-(uracil(54)-C(5))-methyltransferase (FADH(2)-oxidizing) TrmFO [Candidatus Cloacimonetes bacterium]|nr:methylenetetrahydrofolate--tRNA-(uracil(54)-C(5))-methyltransferase (FADH(2)-oxidizing) TrmFO [Candidatus Cloacimonadota bacterium]